MVIFKAVDYLGRAAQQALSRSAFSEALVQVRAGVALIPALPATAERGRREFDLLSTLVRAATAIEGWGSPQTAQGYRRMLELARESGDDDALLTALLGVWVDHGIAARLHEAAEMARQILMVAERIKTPAALADAHHAWGWTSFWTGHVSDGLTALNRAITLCPDGAGRINFDAVDPLVESLSYAAMSAWATGYPDRAVNLIDSAIKRSRELKHSVSLAYALFFQTWIHSMRGEVLGTQHLSEQLGAVAEEGGFVSWVALNRIYRGWVMSMQGEHEQGIALIRSGIADWAPIRLTYHSSILAEACLRAGRYQEAMDAVAAGREHAAGTGKHFAESEVERVAGETVLLMSTVNTAEAEQCMRRAVTIAKEQGAKSFELRATTSLARLLRDSDRRDEARAMLAEI